MRRAFALAAVSVATLVLGPAAGAADSHETISGSGSSWAAIAVNQWVADVEPSGLKVIYTANGSAAGRKDFALGTTDFAVSDIGYQGRNPETGDSDTSNGRAYAYLPIAGGGTAFPYHIEVGGKLYRNLRLSGSSVAKIFTNQITNWADPQITADNNGVALPNLPIIPVVHSEGAGTSAQFTKYLAQQYPDIWGPFNGGHDTFTEFYPVKGNAVAQNGSDGVMNYVASAAADGAIGVDEYAYPLAKNYPAAKVENSAGYFTLPTQYNVAVALTQAVINNDPSSPDYLLQDLRNVYSYTDPRTYPLSSYAYAIIPTAAKDPTMNTAKRQTLADYLYYSICQGQAEIGPIGYTSLPVNLVQAGFAQLHKLQEADPGVDLTNRDVSTCHNPTFIPGRPDQNHLAAIAPQPLACDKAGAGPCTGATPGAPKPPAAASPAGGVPTTSASVPGTVSRPTTSSTSATDPLIGQADPGSATRTPELAAGATTATGLAAGATTATELAAGALTATELPAERQSSVTAVMAGTAAVLLLLLLFAPAVVYQWLRRPRDVAA